MSDENLIDTDDIGEHSGGACSWEGVHKVNGLPTNYEMVPQVRDTYKRPLTPERRREIARKVNTLTMQGGISTERALRRITELYESD